jgi:hypothetical protein
MRVGWDRLGQRDLSLVLGFLSIPRAGDGMDARAD